MISSNICRYAVMAAMAYGATIPTLLSAAPPQGGVVVNDRAPVDARRAEVLDRLVSVTLDKVPLKSAIKAIAEAAGVRVQFRSMDVEAVTMPVTLHADRMALGNAMGAILRGTALAVQPIRADLISIEPTGDGNVRALGEVRGVIIDAKTRRPVRGVTVMFEGNNKEARTDSAGVYHFAGVNAGTHTVRVRMIGFGRQAKTVTVENGGTATLDFALETIPTALQDVVTTVTGPQRRLELGNSVEMIKADSLVKEAPITSLSQLLTARVPGLMVTQSQGTVGGNVRLQIRGMTSPTMATNPIVIVDGMRYSSVAAFSGRDGEPVSPLNDLNPNDVESVEVVKGPSAATLYGTDASNGVIVITTKRGKAGPPRWTAFATGMRNEIPRQSAFPIYMGWASSFNGVPGVYRNCSLQSVAQQSCTQDSVTYVKSPIEQDEYSTLRPAQSYAYGLGVSGGQQTLRYVFSGNYDSEVGGVAMSPAALRLYAAQHGVPAPKEMRRPNTQTLLNLRSNVAATLSPKLDVNVNAGYTRGNRQTIQFASSAVSQSAITYDTLVPNILALDRFSLTSAEVTDRFLVSAQGQSQTISWLTTRANIGMDLGMRKGNDLQLPDAKRLSNKAGSVREGHTQQLAVSADGGATATFRRGRLSTRTSVGTQYVRTVSDILLNGGSDLPPGATTVDRAKNRSVTKAYYETITLGSYVEETVGLNDRLFLTGALRADGASTFGEGFSAVTYPKVSASWLASEEPFLPRVPTLDELRLRVAYGEAGRQPLVGSAAPSYYVRSVPTAISNGSFINIDALGNPFLRPELSRELEAGFDAGFFQRRLQLELTWYRRNTTDLLMRQDMPSGLGSQWINVGLVRENGAESRITTTLLDTRPLSWSVSWQRSSHYTKLIRAGQLSPWRSLDGSPVEGYALGARFVTPLVGYADTNGDGFIAPDEVQTGDSAVYAGLNAPSRLQTISTTLGLFQQRLRLSALFDRQTGGTIEDTYLSTCRWCRGNYDPTAPLILQAYRAALSVNKPFLPGTRSMVSGNFTRLREVSGAFTMPQGFTRALRASSSSVSLSARNLALWSKLKGLDPESSQVLNGLTQQAPIGLPQSRTWVMRVDLGF